jgi:hypothetical protein
MLGAMWIAFGLASALGSWAFLDSLGKNLAYPIIVLILGVLGGLLLILVSKQLKTPRRVFLWAALVGALIAPPILSLLGFAGFAFILLTPGGTISRELFWSCATIGTCLWISIDLRDLRARINATRYIEREFAEFEDRIEMRWERKTNIAALATSHATFLGRLWNLYGFKILIAIAPFSAAGYATSRLLQHAGCPYGVLLLLAALGAPLSIWVVSQLVCGAYLNIYKIWQMEQKTGKHVVFDHIPIN